jgi:hypothetical protein
LASFIPEVHAAPQIVKAEGRLSNGEPIAVLGTGFGAKNAAGPAVFETMESGSFSPRWTGTGDLSIVDDIQRHRFSKHNARLNFKPGSVDGSFALSKDASRTWFVSYWFRLEPNWNWGTTSFSGDDRFLSRLQMVRLRDRFNSGEDIQILVDAPGDRVVLTAAEILPDDGITLTSGIRGVLTKRRWHQFQLAYQESSSPGFEDGTLDIWLNGVKIVARNVWGPNKAAGEREDPINEFLIDDVYVDVSLARVELGDRPSYDECTHREVQRIDTWSDQKISFHVNQGAFPDGTPVFVFVHDAQGRVNAAGFPWFSGEEGQKLKNPGGTAALVPEIDRISLAKGTKAEFGPSAFDVRIYHPDGTMIAQQFRINRARLMWGGENKDSQVQPGRYLCKITGLWGDVAFHTIEVNP